MLYVILDNGDFVTLLEGEPGEPVLDYLKEHDRVCPDTNLSEFLMRQGFGVVPFNVVETVDETEGRRSQSSSNSSIYIVLDDGELWTVVRGAPNEPLYQYLFEFAETPDASEFTDFLVQEKGFERVQVEVFDRIDAIGAVRYSQQGRKFIRIFTN